MNKIFITLTLAASLSLLTACGGGGSSDFDDEIGSFYGPPVAGVDPIVVFDSTGSNSSTFDNGNRTETVFLDSGYAGDIEALTVQQSNGFIQITQLRAGIPSMNITDIQRTQALEFLCDDNRDIRITIATDFSSGEEEISGSINGVSQSCSSTYDSVLQTTVDNDSIEDLIFGYGNLSNFNTTLISTNCLDDDTYTIPDPAITLCNGKMLTNFVVINDFNVEHSFTHQIQYDYSD